MILLGQTPSTCQGKSQRSKCRQQPNNRHRSECRPGFPGPSKRSTKTNNLHAHQRWFRNRANKTANTDRKRKGRPHSHRAPGDPQHDLPQTNRTRMHTMPGTCTQTKQAQAICHLPRNRCVTCTMRSHGCNSAASHIKTRRPNPDTRPLLQRRQPIFSWQRRENG